MMKEYRLESDTLHESIDRLQYLMNTIPEKIRDIPHDDFVRKTSPDKWSKKEILGHLIDSATNNHHRFVRTQFELEPTILYNQNEWNQHGYYDSMEDDHIVSFWTWYNRHIIELVRRIPPHLMERACKMEDGTTRSISWLFDDYVRHLEHHLKAIFP